MRTKLRAGERKSLSKYRQHFAGARMMAGVTYSFLVMVAPIIAIVFACFIGFESFQHIHVNGLHAGFSHQPVMFGMAAAGFPSLNSLSKEDSAALAKHMDALSGDLKAWCAKRDEEAKNLGKVSDETKAAVEKAANELAQVAARVLAVEQKLTSRNDSANDTQIKSIGQLFIESEEFKARKAGVNHVGKVNIGHFHRKTALVNATGQNQPLVPDYRVPGIVTPPEQRLTIRDLIPSLPVGSNLVQFVRETAFTNAAASQAGENVDKAESALTFALDNAAVITLAHWIPASRQILDDAPALQGYINQRLTYGLKLKEEDELLNGAGTTNHLSGLVTEAAVYDDSRDLAGDTQIDTIRRAITQIRRANFAATAIIVNPIDWEKIELTKDQNDNYIFSNPHGITGPSLWGRPVVDTESMPEGKFLVGDFQRAATIWDRSDATVEVSREHSDFFIKNMVAILAEERLTLTVYQSAALSYGTFPQGS